MVTLLTPYHLICFFNMAVIDIILLVILGAGVIMGFTKGFLKQLASILGLIVGLFAAKALYATVAVKISPLVDGSMSAAHIISFIAIWIIVPLIFVLIASLITKAMDAIHLGWINRLLGAILGGLKYLLLGSILIVLLEYIDHDNQLIDKTKKENSVLYYPMQKVAELFLPAAKKITQQYINEFQI